MAKTNKNTPLELDQAKATAGMLALLAEEREARIDKNHNPRKTEAILSGAGLTNSEIAALIGKNPNAVGMTVTRAATKPKVRKRGRR